MSYTIPEGLVQTMKVSEQQSWILLHTEKSTCPICGAGVYILYLKGMTDGSRFQRVVDFGGRAHPCSKVVMPTLQGKLLDIDT